VNQGTSFSRRALLKSLGWAPILFRPSALFGSAAFSASTSTPAGDPSALAFSDVRLTPHYPLESPLADIFRRVPPGSDEYITEKYAFEIEDLLRRWGAALIASPQALRSAADFLSPALQASSFTPAQRTKIRSSFGIDIERRTFNSSPSLGRDRFLETLDASLGPATRVRTAEFEIFQIEAIAQDPLAVRVDLRYDLVLDRANTTIEERIGSWHMEWVQDASQAWKARRWIAGEENASSLRGPAFIDITTHALGANPSYANQFLHGSDYWRTMLDGAIGVDVYCNNGVAAGDYDNDGFDDLYICQPAGLPNRLYRNRGDGTFEDVTEKAGVGVLDNTASALFADFRNCGLQDLLVLCGTGPLLFQNRGDGTFARKHDAFRFAQQPQGTFTHAAAADYDGDGRLDLYLCTYMYYLGLDQYHYPIPYYDARNGPPNCLFHNEGNLTFVETTGVSGMNAENNRYSFACAWGDSNSNGRPDLFVVNDFGSSQLYRNEGNGHFTHASSQAHVENVGAGMSCCWCDFDNDGLQDVYVPSMWEAAGQRISSQAQFHAQAPDRIRELYQRHARGNALYRNRGDGTFDNVGHQAAVEMGRWSWCSDFFDFDHDGYSDLYVANGYLSSVDRQDLASFFWRQVVAKSSEDATPAQAYERGWNAINELVRSDHTWHGYARNVLFANNHNGTFSELSGPSGLDFIEDSRCFALSDIDHDGRLEIILKNRNAPQLRVVRNNLTGIGRSLSFRLRGVKSNRDAIGASVTVETSGNKQTKYLQAGTGFLAQNSKELFFGIGDAPSATATVRWPSGLVQHFDALPADHAITCIEGEKTFSSAPYRPTAHPPAPTAASQAPEELPHRVQTWLIEPLRAPAFSLPDTTGTTHALNDLHGSPALLVFWSSESPESLDLLDRLQQHKTALRSSSIAVLAVNVDAVNVDNDQAAARAFAAQKRFAFPTVFADPSVSGVYNIVYSHLYDRRRNLPLPASFLLDSETAIVKVYQGVFDPQQVARDVREIPRTATERSAKALPFPGLLAQADFQRNIFTYGVAFYQNGYLDQAAETFRQVIAVRPDDADAWYNLGTLSLRRKQNDQARQALEQTVKLRPDYPEAWNNLGMLAAQAGNADDAIHNFQRSLDLRPNYAIALVNLGNLYRTRRVYDKAGDCLQRALQLDPRDPEVNYSLGMLYAQQGQADQAAHYLQTAIQLRPAYPEAINNLGVLYVRQQDYAKAEAQFKEGMRVAPAFDQSYLNLARLYIIQNNRPQAQQTLLDLLRVQPDNTAAKQALEMLR
jgi:tetratricopeptide (TPR) repeat protein